MRMNEIDGEGIKEAPTLRHQATKLKSLTVSPVPHRQRRRWTSGLHQALIIFTTVFQNVNEPQRQLSKKIKASKEKCHGIPFTWQNLCQVFLSVPIVTKGEVLLHIRWDVHVLLPLQRESE